MVYEEHDGGLRTLAVRTPACRVFSYRSPNSGHATTARDDLRAERSPNLTMSLQEVRSCVAVDVPEVKRREVA